MAWVLDHMDLVTLLRTLRRYWALILALTVVGAGIGVLSAQFEKDTKKSRTFYRATTTLVVDLSQRSGQSTSAFQSLDQVPLYATTGAVPDAVAKKLGSDATGQELAEHITTTTNGATSTIAITAAEPEADDATRLADAFADVLIANLDERGQDAYAQARDKLQAQLDSLTNQQNTLFAQIASNPPNVENLKSQLSALNNQYRLTYDSYSQLAAAGPPTSRFTVLQKADAVPIDKQEYDARLALGASSRNNLTADSGSDTLDEAVSTSSGAGGVNGPVARGVLGGALGFLIAIGIVLLLARLDRRILSRADAEAAFQLPVLAEVPQITRAQQRDTALVAHTAPLSRFTEAFRAIRSSVLFTRAAMEAEGAGAASLSLGTLPNGTDGTGTLFEPDHGDPLVVMVTSASPGEGKTTSTANLAAVFAEAGASVLVVNCDFRRPMIHRYFGLDDEPRRVHETEVPGVKVVTNVLSDPASNPSQVVAAQRQVVAAARGRFDVILLDTAPLLTANDAVELVSSADLLLLVARVGSTRVDTAERSMELLNRLDVPIAGLVLVGVESASNDYYYYYQPGRVDTGRKSHPTTTSAGGGNNANGNGRASEAEMFVPEPAPTDPGRD
jgi:Mrp family chromosome partitioning ATPase/capsular polysaccharide biosynthesis protein